MVVDWKDVIRNALQVAHVSVTDDQIDVVSALVTEAYHSTFIVSVDFNELEYASVVLEEEQKE